MGPSPRIVVTGGPGAGKTALLEIARKNFCLHVAVLPESASIVFGGGFPRRRDDPSRRAAQRAIFHVQRELEALYEADRATSIALLDRGTVDGLAYWPGPPEEYWSDVGSTLAAELARYDFVLHLRTPDPERYTNGTNRLRIETAIEAHAIDERILAAWGTHPRRVVVPAAADFLGKIQEALAVLRAEIPPVCARCRAAAALAGVPAHDGW